MHSGLFLPTFSRRTLQHVMQPYGAPFKLVWAPLRRTRHAPLGTSPCSWPALAGWDYRRPRAPARRPIGRERCPAFSEWDARGPACLRTASEARRLLVVAGWTDVPSWELLEQGARPPDRPDGIAEPGEWSAHGTCSSATTCCCLFCRLPTVRSCVPRPVRTPLHGSKLSQATPTPRSPLRQCISRCAAGSGSNSRSHPAAAGALRNLVAAAVRMLLEICTCMPSHRPPGKAGQTS